MAKIEANLKSEVVRLARREIRMVSVPMARDARLLKNKVSQIRKTVLALERFMAAQKKEVAKREIRLEASPEELKKSRLSPRLIQTVRKRLGISQKELAHLVGVTVGAVHMWEAGKFKPKDEKRKVFVALRKLPRGEVKRLLEERRNE
jgi:DNA-binding transcriptional regulator YiaG